MTPVLAMLGALADEPREREVWWIHGARNGDEHAFGGEARAHVAGLPRGRSHVRYSRPHDRDLLGRDYDAAGRLTAADSSSSASRATPTFACAARRPASPTSPPD